MSKSGQPKTFTVPWRRACAVLPSIALIGGGIAVSAPPAELIRSVAVSSSSTAVVVPDEALSMPAPAGISTDASQLAAEVAPATELAGTMPSSSFVSQDSSGIPVRALEGYRVAASLVGSADPACHIDWALLAAIGRVESNHARFGGNELDSAGVAQPGIIGIPLDGSNGTARITDTDRGLLDRDTVYDRAVGPMQFIPGTWRVSGVDADGDGVKNPQDIADAATAAAVYLCSGPGDLTAPGDLHAAIMRYNASESYVALVESIADTYRLGVSALPAPDVTPASLPAPTTLFTVSPTVSARSGSVVSPTGAVPVPTVNGVGALVAVPPAPPTISATADPTATVPAQPVPAGADPTTTVAPVPDPTTTVPPLPDPTATIPPVVNPTTTVSPVPDPTTTVAPVPDPTTTLLPDPCATSTDPAIPTPTVTDPAVPTPTLPAALCPTATATATATDTVTITP